MRALLLQRTDEAFDYAILLWAARRDELLPQAVASDQPCVAAYRQLLREVLFEDDLTSILTYLKQQRALGRDDFRAMVEAKTQRLTGTRPAHRMPRPGK